MRTVWLLLTLSIPVTVSAQSWLQAPAQQQQPPMPPGRSIMQLHPVPGMTSYWDTQHHSTATYEMMPGVSGYTQRDSSGRVTGQGLLFDPMPERRKPSVLDTGNPADSDPYGDR